MALAILIGIIPGLKISYKENYNVYDVKLQQ